MKTIHTQDMKVVPFRLEDIQNPFPIEELSQRLHGYREEDKLYNGHLTFEGKHGECIKAIFYKRQGQTSLYTVHFTAHFGTERDKWPSLAGFRYMGAGPQEQLGSIVDNTLRYIRDGTEKGKMVFLPRKIKLTNQRLCVPEVDTWGVFFSNDVDRL